MKIKMNLIISVFSLTITAFLLILVAFSWYTTNKEVQANGIFGSSEGEKYSLELQKGTYDGSTWNWEATDEITLSNIAPNDAFFFRIKIESEGTDNFIGRFANISSQLQSTKLTVSDGKVCFISDTKYIPYYSLDENDEVKVDDKILYSYDSGTGQITLGEDYYIQNTFYFYSFDEVPTDDSIPASGGILLENSEFTFSSTGTNESEYFYFMLEFNESASLKTINEIECSNAYLFQKLSIGKIFVYKQ